MIQLHWLLIFMLFQYLHMSELSGAEPPMVRGISEVRLVELATEGSVKAQLILAMCADLSYDESRSRKSTSAELSAIHRDYIKWYSMAAAYGSKFAICELVDSTTYASGNNYADISKAAFEMSFSAWDEKNLILGLVVDPQIANSMNISEDEVQQILLKRLGFAAEADPHASLMMSHLFRVGLLLPINEDKAKQALMHGIELLEERARKIPEHYLFLGDLYAKGSGGISPDPDRAAKYYSDGLKNGVAECEGRLLRLGK